MGKHRTLVLAAGIAASVLASLAPAAFADNYTISYPILNQPALGVGTEGDDASGDLIALTHGGCAKDATIAVAVGESNRQCDDGRFWFNGDWEAQSEANGANAAVGLLGADAHSWGVAVASDGDAYAECSGSLEPFCWTVALSGTGGAYGPIAISGTGPATARHRHWGYDRRHVGIAVSGTGDASADNSAGPTGIAVSGTGNASGSTLGVSVLGGRKAAGSLAFRGRASLPQFPCPNPPGTGCWGTFAGDWTGSVSGTHHGSAFEASWTTTTSALGASFRYWELACLAGAETLAGQADGTGSASAAANQVVGHWLERGETGPRAIIGAGLSFTFHWTRSANAAVLLLEPTTLNLDVAGLGRRTVASGLQTGTAAFALTSADNTTVPTCSTPLNNAKAEVVGHVPLTFVG